MYSYIYIVENLKFSRSILWFWLGMICPLVDILFYFLILQQPVMSFILMGYSLLNKSCKSDDVKIPLALIPKILTIANCRVHTMLGCSVSTSLHTDTRGG